jgi:hypothetical protein
VEWNGLVRLVSVALLFIFGMGLGTLRAGDNKWRNVGPAGGYVVSVAIDPQNSSTVYAVTEAGAFKSNDGGASWNNAGMIAAVNLAIVPKPPSTIYAVTGCSGVGPIVKSTDASWNPASIGLPAVCCLTLAMDPDTVYAAGHLPTNADLVVLPRARMVERAGVRRTLGCLGPISVGIPSGGLIDPKNPGMVYLADFRRGVFKPLTGAHWCAITLRT